MATQRPPRPALPASRSRPQRGSSAWTRGGSGAAAVGAPPGTKGGQKERAFALPRSGRRGHGPGGDNAAACVSGLPAPAKPSPRRSCALLDRRASPARIQGLAPRWPLHHSADVPRQGRGPEMLASAHPHARHLLLDSANSSARLPSRPPAVPSQETQPSWQPARQTLTPSWPASP